ncbi:MAG: sigma 54-interacting transcriptional regulator, partial [Pseudomonadota bacterium]
LLIIGETGVGKEPLSVAVFEAGEKYKDVFVTLDLVRGCRESPMSPDRAIGSDRDSASSTREQARILFGVEERGADGSPTMTAGYLTLAANGTLFIRGAEMLTVVTQQRLLDAVRTSAFCPEGGSRVIRADFRLICTTYLDPSLYSIDRHPLLHALQDFSLRLPPLRERRAEIPFLVDHYLAYHSERLNKRVPEPGEGTLDTLMDYSWPGNDQELSTVIRRAVVATPSDVVRPKDLSFYARRASGRGRTDWLRFRPIRRALLSPLFPAVLQSAFLPIFLVILMLLFLGPPDPSKNLAGMVMWATAWPGMIIGAFFGARVWCSVCAIGAISRSAKRIISLEIPFPHALKIHSDFLIAGGILFIIWLETAIDIRNSPFNLGLLLLTMFIIAFVLNTLYTRQAWCRYICPLGGMNGLLSRTSMLELRADADTCLSLCGSHECYVGGDKAEGCPFGQVAATLHSNQFCKICANCLKNCPHGAIRLNLRLPGLELGEIRHVRTGTGFLVLGLLGGLLSDMATRMSFYAETASWMPLSGVWRFTLVFVGTIAGINLMAALAAGVSHRVFGERFQENYSRFALALLPLTCMGLLAFHTYYLVTFAVRLPELLDPYFHFSTFRTIDHDQLIHHIRWIQFLLVAVGLAWSINVIYRLVRALPGRPYPRIAGALPHVVTAVILAWVLVKAMSMTFGPVP